MQLELGRRQMNRQHPTIWVIERAYKRIKAWQKRVVKKEGEKKERQRERETIAYC